MVYTLVLGTSAVKSVEVRVLSRAHFDRLSVAEFGKVSVIKEDEKARHCEAMAVLEGEVLSWAPDKCYQYMENSQLGL